MRRRSRAILATICQGGTTGPSLRTTTLAAATCGGAIDLWLSTALG